MELNAGSIGGFSKGFRRRHTTTSPAEPSMVFYGTVCTRSVRCYLAEQGLGVLGSTSLGPCLLVMGCRAFGFGRLGKRGKSVCMVV